MTSGDHELVTEFCRAEAEYWRAVTAARDAVLREIQRLVSSVNPGLPPEPPVGTVYHDDHTGDVTWYRDTNGWHCPGNECKNCPVDWVEANGYLKPNWRRELPVHATE